MQILQSRKIMEKVSSVSVKGTKGLICKISLRKKELKVFFKLI